MSIQLSVPNELISSSLSISGSKSESNRLLLLQKLYGNIQLNNISDAQDVEVMQKALANNSSTIDVHHAGTAMRFLTAYFAVTEQKSVLLTGSERMQNRPLKILVEALQKLGANIEYVKKEGFPPLQIKGKEITKNEIELSANVSSQYISALLLVAPKLAKGLKLKLKGEITSLPYLKMTLDLLKEIGVKYTFENQLIEVFPKNEIEALNYTIESDWSSASYHFSMVALAEDLELELKHFKNNSLQGDAKLVEIYLHFGVKASLKNGILKLQKQQDFQLPETIQLNLIQQPDLAQTIAVTCLGLGINCKLTGLHTLKIKETDRLQALKNELEKFGAQVEIDEQSLFLKSPKKLHADVLVKTYQDHRMAMAFAPLATKTSLKIEDPEVVEKSYPNFWKDLKKIGFSL
ncbi:3-phosphoshikimate 1-carboxyvinyltransferase [Psychroflexus planctonicus]|uniref:3-phosphoshikimate 1-carboxyvinyltransferase n=1 Tax=Psychroflexus planctonicus TaxID=1526575 RepID=A0ABQ1SD44_9FLAO|nr:3-phosphoshikimate 1-carboxyvinyltransferase [Psychroflexus planctonicus]GGE29956.1 3-phosphoshikimate 1-carboxyvinyltransferase [Psychroflexus planctonicus]